MDVYYGRGASGMVEIYRTLQRQARSWQTTWDRVVSRVRGPGYGNSEGKGIGTARHDLALEAPPLPDAATLAFTPRFAARYRKWIGDAPALSQQNDELRHALTTNILRVERNRYNLEVFLALARLTGHHWALLTGLAAAEQDLARAAAEAAKLRPAAAVGHMVSASNRVARIEQDAVAVRKDLTSVFEQSRYPNGREAGGRKFAQVLDDTKDHWAGRTPDLGYMFAGEQSIGLSEWRARLDRIASDYAARNKVPLRGLVAPRLEE
jgi:hypothetical protein